MKDKTEIQLIKNRTDYLSNLANIISLPHLKTHYRFGARYILENSQDLIGPTPAAAGCCTKCLLLPYETQLRQSIKPPVYNHFVQKYKYKKTLTKFQHHHLKQIKKLNQQELIVQCSTCKNTVKYPLIKPAKPEKIQEIVTVKTKKKKKKKNSLAGINKAAVEEAQNHGKPIVKDFISLELTPVSTQKRKFDDVIVIEDSPLPVQKKQKLNLHENIRNNNNNQVDIKAMKQKAKEVEEARKTMTPLATKKDKRKMKHQLKKLQDTIKNIEHQNNKPKSSLQDFLSTLSV